MSESSMVLGDEKVDMLRKKKKKSKKNKENIDTIGCTTTDGNAIESDVSVEEEKLSDVETSKKGDGAKKQAKRAGGDDCDVKRKKKRDGGTHPGKADKDDDDDTAKSVEKKKRSKLKSSHHDKRQKMDDASLGNNTIAHASTSETWDDKMETEAAGGDACDVKRKKKKEVVTHPGKSNKDRDEDVVESVEKKKHKRSKRSDQDEQQIMDDTSLNNKTIPHTNANETRGDKMESIAAGDDDCYAKGKEKTEVTHPGKSKKDRDEDAVGNVEKKKRKKLKRSHQDEQQIAPFDEETIANASANETPDTGKAVEAFSNGSGENSMDEIRRKKKKSKKSNKNAATNGVALTNTDVIEEIEDEGRTGHSNIKKRKKVKLGHTSEDSTHGKSEKRVRFSGDVQIFPLSSNPNDENQEMQEENLVRGKRFSKLEDETVKEAVHKYIEIHNLGEEGLQKILNSRSHPEVKGCWKEIGSAIPYRPYSAVYYRAQILFRRSESRKWTKEEYEMVRKFQKEHGNNWKALAEELGKHRFHVKDTWRRLKLPNQNKGQWTQEEYQNLFDLVNTDLRLKLSEEKKSKHGMLRDNIPWTAISDRLSTRTAPNCCLKWYDQLTSPMVAKGEWDDADDYRLVDSLFELDASCIEDVDWDNLLDHRPGEICRKRWNQMVHHIGQTVGKSFAEQVEVLAKRYRPDLAEVREAWDSKPVIE